MSLPFDKMLLQESMRYLVSQCVIDVGVWSTLIGMWIWGALLRRDLLSAPKEVFRVMMANEGRRARWWRSAQREVASMAELVVFMKARLTAPVAPTLFATDARGPERGDAGAYAVVAANAGRSLATRCAVQGVRPGFSVTRLDGSFTGRRSQEEPWRRQTPFSLLEIADFPFTGWEPVHHGRWKYPDHITLGEGRTVVKVARALAAVASCHRRRVAALEDNMAVSGATAKGRSPSPALNYLCRQKAANTVSAQIQLLLPWVETSRQPADELSRLREVPVQVSSP